MDIIYVVLLLYSNGRIAARRGHKPAKYCLITMGLCFGLEIIGSLAGILITLIGNPESTSLTLAYFLGLLGIVIGSIWSRKIVSKAPVVNQQDRYTRDMYYGSSEVWKQEGYYKTIDPSVYDGHEAKLAEPATIRIINEYFWNDDAKDLFFLNNIPVCTLQPGNEYTFLSTSVKNVFSIGRPDYPAYDTEHSIRFVAAEKGYIEIVIKDGKIVIDRFKNLKAK